MSGNTQRRQGIGHASIQCLLFDFAGVIANDAFWEMVESLVPDLTPAQRGSIAALTDESDRGSISLSEYLDRLARLTGIHPDYVWSTLKPMIRIDMDMVGLVDRLHGIYRTGLLTNSREEWMREILEEHRLERLFDSVIISSAVGAIKPDPVLFRFANRQLGMPPSKILFIDDRPLHIDAAGSLGYNTHLFTGTSSLYGFLRSQGILK